MYPDYFCCFICNLKLENIYIQCVECIENICLNCFSNGLEQANHLNSHNYKVINLKHLNTFDEWNIQEEFDLINQIEQSKDTFFLNTLTESRDTHKLNHIEKWHYLFGANTHSDTIESFNKFLNDYYSVKTSQKLNQQKRLEFDNKNMPIRPVELSGTFRKLNGYRAARGDFETELNDKYEFKVSADLNPTDLDHEDDLLEAELCSNLLDSYNGLIRERFERKKFIQKFGLLNECSNANQLILNQFSEQIKLDDKQLKTSQLIKFQKYFIDYEDYVKFIELYNHQSYLVKRIEELEQYRQMGIRSLNHVEPYKYIKLKRLNKSASVYMSSLIASLNRSYDSKRLMNNEQLKEWFKQLCISEKSLTVDVKKPQYLTPSFIKHKSNPLKIENYPDFDKLNEDEREFCRVSRIQPAVFLKVKTILITENSKSGQCSYSRARKIAGIDVNKTRVIHSYMITNNLIKASLQENS